MSHQSALSVIGGTMGQGKFITSNPLILLILNRYIKDMRNSHKPL